MPKFAREKIHDLWPELLPLAEADWAEVAWHAHPLRVNTAAYEALENANALRVYTAREEGELVGFVIYVTSPSIRHAFTVAQQDVIYIKPAHRGFASRLFAWANKRLAEEGVRMVQWGSPMTRVGSKMYGRVYVREL